MKTINHHYNDTSVCIYSIKDNIIDGAFFKEKPEPGDIIFHKKFPMHGFVVEEVLSVRDAIICSSCTHDPRGARMKLKVQSSNYYCYV